MRAKRDAALIVVTALAVLAVLATVVVYRAGHAAASSVADKNALVIGIDGDRPGLGTKTPGGAYEGFEVDVATYVAGRLGVAGGAVKFTAIRPGGWERALTTGAVDLVFAADPITPELAGRVAFAGPYYVAHQSILVRAHDESIKNVRDLGGKRLCEVAAAGDRSAEHVTQDLGIAAVLVPAGSYADCVELLARGRLDRRPGTRRRRRQGERRRRHDRQRPVHRRALRRRAEEGRRQGLRGGQQGAHGDVPERRRQHHDHSGRRVAGAQRRHRRRAAVRRVRLASGSVRPGWLALSTGAARTGASGPVRSRCRPRP
jgi:hypothetical protein